MEIYNIIVLVVGLVWYGYACYTLGTMMENDK